jgi:hypothetical protein
MPGLPTSSGSGAKKAEVPAATHSLPGPAAGTTRTVVSLPGADSPAGAVSAGDPGAGRRTPALARERRAEDGNAAMPDHCSCSLQECNIMRPAAASIPVTPTASLLAPLPVSASAPAPAAAGPSSVPLPVGEYVKSPTIGCPALREDGAVAGGGVHHDITGHTHGPRAGVGSPIASKCTRSWCRRPVTGRSSSLVTGCPQNRPYRSTCTNVSASCAEPRGTGLR